MTSRPDDTLLNAWLDGELSPSHHLEVAAWLAAHPEDAERVRLWATDGDAIREALDSVLDAPVPDALAQVVWRKTPASTPASEWLRWAAAVAVFVVGGAVGAALVWRIEAQGLRRATSELAALKAAPDGWVQRAAVAHSVYVPEVRHPVEVKAQEDHLSGWLTKRLDVPVKLFDLRAEGFELVGGRLLPDATGPSAQLMYQQIAQPGDTQGRAASGAGAIASTVANAGASTAASTGANAVAGTVAGAAPVRVTVYVRKPDADTPAAFRFEQQGELGLFYWVEGNSPHGGATGYALVGALPRERLLALAEAIYKQGLPKP